MTEELVRQNLLPSLSLRYLEKDFDKIDTNPEAGKVATLTLDEIKAAQSGLRKGSINETLYQTVVDMMKRDNRSEIDKTQLSEMLKESNNNFQSQDKKNAAEFADALMNDSSLFSNIAHNDGVITRDELDDFLDKPGNASPEDNTKAKMAARKLG